MLDSILLMVADGGIFTVRPHDVLNPKCGYLATLETARGTTTANGDTATQAVEDLAWLLRGEVTP